MELARIEEQLSMKKAIDLFEKGLLDSFEIGTFKGLAQMHDYLFNEIYNFDGKLEMLTLLKGGFCFAHPFRGGNGRSTCIWLDRI